MEKGFTPFPDVLRKPQSGALLEEDPYPELTCEELEDKISELKSRRGRRSCHCLEFSESEELSRLERALEERERNGLC